MGMNEKFRWNCQKIGFQSVKFNFSKLFVDQRGLPPSKYPEILSFQCRTLDSATGVLAFGLKFWGKSLKIWLNKKRFSVKFCVFLVVLQVEKTDPV